jgi:hypothetical protein
MAQLGKLDVLVSPSFLSGGGARLCGEPQKSSGNQRPEVRRDGLDANWILHFFSQSDLLPFQFLPMGSFDVYTVSSSIFVVMFMIRNQFFLFEMYSGDS